MDTSIHINKMTLELEDVDILLIYGAEVGYFFEKFSKWLEEKKERRIFFIEDDEVVFSRLVKTAIGKKILTSGKAELHYMQTPIALEPLIKEIAWRTVFLKTKLFAHPIYMQKRKEEWETIKALTYHILLGVHLTASEYSDFGVKIFENIYRNLIATKDIWELENLKGSFEKIPAVICGAGPSLKKNGHLLRQISSKALLFAGGSALNVLEELQVRPSFISAIDQEAPYSTFKRQSYWEIPFLFQNRMSHENYSLIHGKRILAPPNGGYPLEGHLYQKLHLQNLSFDAGWNVSTFLIQTAHFLGCRPIILVGMDLAFTDNISYAEGAGLKQKKRDSHLVISLDQQGKEVFTQKDWLMAASWTNDFSKKHPEIVLNCTEGGLGFESVPNCSLKEVIENVCTSSNDLKGIMHQALSVSSKELNQERTLFNIRQIESSLFLMDLLVDWALEQLEKAFHGLSFEEYEIKFLEEITYLELLDPLWRVFKPIFEREIEKDNKGIQLELNRLLFFKQVIESHLKMMKKL